MSEELIFRSDEATKGGFQAIKRVEGILLPLKRVASKFTEGDYGIPSDQIEIVLEDAVILEMEPGEPEPELKDGKYTSWMNYAKPGKEKAHQNTFYVKGFLKSAEEICDAQGIPKTVPNYGIKHFYNTRVILEKRTVPLFKKPVEGSEEKEEITGTNLVFSAEEAETGVDINEHIKGLIVGKNKQTALRAILMDNKAKRHPEYREALNNDTIGEMAGVIIDNDGVYREGLAA